MRRTVEVIWLEDRLNTTSHTKRVTFVKNAIENKGYDSNISQIKTLSEAKEILMNKNKRVDFFISDYNLGDDETGLEYLIEVRTLGLYKQFFVLYSNNDYDEIRSDLISKLQETNIELFSNFTFITLNAQHSVEEDFNRAVKMSLSRWDELNAMRGLYMCEHAELEWKLREKYNKYDEHSSTYKSLFHELKRSTTQVYKKSHSDVFQEWEKLINMRNLLAHMSEGYDEVDGFFIKSSTDEEVIIYENKLDEDRMKLKQLKDKIIFLITNPNRPWSR